jgi:hypothetical protein
MPIEERVMSRAAETAREASKTHALMKKNAGGGEGYEQSSRDGKDSAWSSPSGESTRKDRVMSRAAEMTREASETHPLQKECRARTGWWGEQQRWKGKRLKLTFWWQNAEKGQGDEQSSRDDTGSVWNSPTAERMPAMDRVISRAAEMAKEASETHALGKKNADGGEGDEQRRRGVKESVWNSRAGEKECRGRTGWWAE